MKASGIFKLSPLKLIAVLFSLIVVIFLCGSMIPAENMSGMKPKLLTIDDCVRKTLGKSAGQPLTQADYEKIKSLSAPNEGIDDLNGIQLCVNLKKLDLSRNEIRDITLLQDLTDLTDLDLRDNQITDLSPLVILVNLRTLNLDRNKIRFLNGLANLKKLNTLILANNKIEDISPIRDLLDLTFLDLGGNSKLSDIEALMPLTNLHYVNLIQTALHDQRDLDNIASLTKRGVYIEKNGVERNCVRQLQMIGSSELAYSLKNPNRDYCSLNTLRKVDPYVKRLYPSNIIADYSLSIFRVVQSKPRLNKATRRYPSSFTIVAMPKANRASLRTFVISSSQTVRVWIGDDKQWTDYPIRLANPDLWLPLR